MKCSPETAAATRRQELANSASPTASFANRVSSSSHYLIAHNKVCNLVNKNEG